jgi:uncharacterized sodium:solute symporter family permease YidK
MQARLPGNGRGSMPYCFSGATGEVFMTWTIPAVFFASLAAFFWLIGRWLKEGYSQQPPHWRDRRDHGHSRRI